MKKCYRCPKSEQQQQLQKWRFSRQISSILVSDKMEVAQLRLFFCLAFHVVNVSIQLFSALHINHPGSDFQ
jgi:hypothetical protein